MIAPDQPRYQVPDEHWGDLARRALTEDRHRFDVAELDDSIVGFVRYFFDEKPWGPSIEVETLVVDEAHRRESVGAALMEHVEKVGRDAGVAGIRLNVLHVNEDGLRFYERLGYTQTATRLGKSL